MCFYKKGLELNMDIKNLLPIGSVIIRNFDGELRKLMIITHNIKGSNGKMYQYGACGYPEGMLNSKIFMFNNSRIGKILYKNKTLKEG